MRRPVDADRLRRLLRALGSAARTEGDCYLTGGATAVLLGWREATIDVDLQFVPEEDDVLRVLPTLKNELEINVELVSPADFVPLPPDASDRRLHIGREGRLTFFHVDPYAQVLAKLERGHVKDLEDVQAMLDLGLVERVRLLELYDAIEPELYRYPAVDPQTFRAAVEEFATRGC